MADDIDGQPDMLDEHQAPGDLAPTGLDQSSSERRLVKKVLKRFSEAKKHRRYYDLDWLDYYRMFRGEQWLDVRPSYRHAEVINLLFQDIQSQVPLLLDSRPQFTFLPMEPSDREFADILTLASDADWDRNNWMMELTEIVYDSHLYGTGIGKTGYDKDADYGMGSVTFESFDPFYFYPDPSATDVNKKGRYVVTAVPTDTELVKEEYPKRAEHIKPDVFDPSTNERTDLNQTKFISPIDRKNILTSDNPVPNVRDKDKTLVVTLWINDNEIFEEKKTRKTEKGDDEEFFEQRLKFPNGRKIVVANGMVLEDGENEFDDGLFPFGRMVNYVLPREFWGVSEIEQLKGPQIVFNKLVSFALDVVTLMGNPVWVVDTASGVDTDNLTNRPGLIVEKEPGTEVRREEGVHLQPFVLQLIDRMKEWFDQVAGTQDITRGVPSQGVTAASAIEQLQEAAQTRVRQKLRNLDAFLKDIGRQWMFKALQFYDVPRVFRVTNAQGANQFFKLTVEKAEDFDGKPILDSTGSQAKLARVRKFDQAEDGREVPGEEKEFLIQGSFDVRVNTGSSLPFTKGQKENRLLNLFDRGIIDEEEVLKGTDFPNADAVLDRIRQKQEAAAAQGAPPQGG